ncbi:TrlF family AAA-like ATPase [Halovivax gelatinilyticus]|uniref:TrlF family AAA-like ATPase n=1 Tax=Halovivax gelatinilyticus TaxID=2961597 RepID=UPI0020CA9435|nr:AAA family ATPase [Halovivax gelatinilyticus]
MVTFDTSGGARFIKADLHVHSPGSYDYEDNVSAEELVDAFEEKGLELVAVTDHNTAEYYDKLAAAAEGSSVTVLPGVEITTGQSGEHQIHMTAIFPPEQADAIDNLLYEIGVEGEPEEAIADKTIPGICDAVREFDGLPILAHIDANAGAHHELSKRKNPTRQNVFDNEKVTALEIISLETESEFPEFTHIRSSDAHSLSQLGRGYTYLKMSTPSFEGLRTALSDPESRVSLEGKHTTHPSVDGLLVEDGFLQNRHLQFNKNLNCLIGGKGTGKSSVIEHIRYALDIEPRSETIEKEFRGLIRSTLGDSGEVQVLLTGNNGDQYMISREYGEEPEIKRVPGGDSSEPQKIEIPIEQFRSEFFDVEIHSQRELLEIARNQTDQLDLLDSYFDIGEPQNQRESVKQLIKEKSREIASLEERVADLEEKKHRFDTLEQQVEVMKEKGVVRFVEGQEEWERERASLANTVSEFDELEEIVDTLDLAGIVDVIEVEEGPNDGLLTSAQKTIQSLNEELNDQQSKLLNTVEEAREEIDRIRREWNEANEEREAKHEELADEIEDEIGVDIEEFFSKQTEMEKLRGIGDELEEEQSNLEDAKAKKAELFEQLEEARQKLTEARQRGVTSLNGELNDVRVSLQPRANRAEYTGWVNHVLEGSRVYTSDKEQITATFDPPELAEIVRNDDAELLLKKTDISPTGAKNFVTHDDLNEQLVKLELLEIRDLPVIELNDGGWKELSEMSDGQQCTALLSIIMVERDVPLIIDQPEDMLDNKFIFTEVVKLIRSIKHDRQIISATHNANIPVLGDAEQIIVMKSNATAGFYRRCGSIDDEKVKQLAQNILEGGEQAFKRRNEKYRRTV